MPNAHSVALAPAPVRQRRAVILLEVPDRPVDRVDKQRLPAVELAGQQVLRLFAGQCPERPLKLVAQAQLDIIAILCARWRHQGVKNA